MQKNKKVSKAANTAKSAKTTAKAAAKTKPEKKATPKAGLKNQKSQAKASLKSAPSKVVAKKAVSETPKTKSPEKVKSKAKGKSKGPKLESRPSPTPENPATNAPLTKEEFKNMSVDDQEHYKKWLKLHKQLSVEKPLEYRMSDDFELKAPISHKVHGWGVVMQKRDNYIDVLFEAGLKTLIVNYKT